MKHVVTLSVILSFACLGCGPSVTQGAGDDDDSADGGDNIDPGGSIDAGENCVAVEDNCFDNQDNDCDGVTDCSDPDCTAVCNPTDGGVCGEVDFGGGPLAIPDGVGMSYETTMDIQGFDAGQTLDSLGGFISVCVTMEHSWLRDLQMEMVCPSGTLIVLNEFLGTVGGEIYMGVPNDNDGVTPVPGTGYEYCWTPTATNPPMLDWANANPLTGTLPAGDYAASGGFDPLVGCDLNGIWTIRVTDDWAIDNGFIFDWSLEFSQDIISDCSGWPVP